MTPCAADMIEDMTLRNFTPQTIRSYVQCVARFATLLQLVTRAPRPRTTSVPTWSTSCQEKRVSLSYYKQTRAALRFLYRVTLGRDDVPDAISRSSSRARSPLSSALMRSLASSQQSATSSTAPSS